MPEGTAPKSAAATKEKDSVRTDFNIMAGLRDADIAAGFYDSVAELRERCPVSWTDEWGGSWHLTRYEDVFGAARDQRTFTTTSGSAPVPNDLEALRMVPLELADPRHRDIRRKLTEFFSRTTVSAQEPIIRSIVEEKIDVLVSSSPCDFAETYGAQLPSRVFTSLVLHEDNPDTVAWILSILDQLAERPDAMGEWAGPLLEWCRTMLKLRRNEGRADDLIGVIAHMGQDDGVDVSERERAECLWLLLLAGMETTRKALNSAGHLLATNPSIREQLRDADEGTLERAVDELLRSHPPVTASNRTLGEDAVIGGCPMRQGDRVLLNWGGGSLDPEVFPNPNEFDLHRPNASKHLSLGGGSHRCLGAALAEAEIRITMQHLAALKQFELVPDASVRWHGGNNWGPIYIPVRCLK